MKPLKGKFTWTNKRVVPGHVAARLDRFLVHSSFLSMGLLASSKILPHCTSDHKPILLELAIEQDLGPIPFRFSQLWIQHDDFLQTVANSWNAQSKGSSSFIWETKIKRLKIDLKDWSRRITSPISKREQAQAELESHQTHMDSSPALDYNLRKEEYLQKNYFSACRIEEDYWRQKSRILWLLSGDKNTKYFHKQAEARKNYKVVSEINFEGELIKDFVGIKKAAMETFKELFTAPIEDPIDISSHPLDLVPHLIKTEENNFLTAPITMDEVKDALSIMKPDSALGPDGFKTIFFTCCWSIIKYDLLKMIRYSQKVNKLGGSTNYSFLALIPKEKGATTFNQF